MCLQQSVSNDDNITQSYTQYVNLLCESDTEDDDDYQLQQGLAASLAANEQPQELIRCVEFRDTLRWHVVLTYYCIRKLILCV